MGVLSPIDDQTPIAAYDPTQSLHTPGGVLPPIMSGGTIANSPEIASTGDQLAKRGLLSHQLGKDIYEAEKPPAPSAAPGTIDWYKQRGQQIEYDKEHPWGSPISKHPGVLGKIFHGLATAGNIAGDIFAPGTMALIPGTHLNRSLEEANNVAGLQHAEAEHNQELEAEAAQTKAAAEKENADTAANKPEKEKNDEEQTFASLVASGKSPLEAFQAVKEAGQKPTKETPAHVTYDQGIPVSVTGSDGKTYDVNDPKLPEELKPLVQSATRAHGQALNEAEQKQAKAFAQQEKMFHERQDAPTTTTRAMYDAAPHVEEFVNRINPLIDKLEKSGDLGPGAGRWNEFWAGKVGSGNPDFVRLRTDVGLLSTLLMRMHVGARGGEYIMQHFSDMINSGKQSPETMRAAIGEIDAYAKQLLADKQNQGGAGESSGGSQRFTVNGVTYNIPTDKVEEFKKDHPNAR